MAAAPQRAFFSSSRWFIFKEPGSFCLWAPGKGVKERLRRGTRARWSSLRVYLLPGPPPGLRCLQVLVKNVEVLCLDGKRRFKWPSHVHVVGTGSQSRPLKLQ